MGDRPREVDNFSYSRHQLRLAFAPTNRGSDQSGKFAWDLLIIASVVDWVACTLEG